MKALNVDELLVAKEIIDKGLEKAAESLSFFMKEPIQRGELGYYENWGQHSWKLELKENPNIHLLTTEIIGELKGTCCLIFTEKEADQLRQTALPKDILENPKMMDQMSDAIMLEVDNIISASVITQFSNILRTKIFGGVPNLKKMNFEQLNNFIESLPIGTYAVNFKTNFMTSKGNFSPEFIWLFDSSFIVYIKKYMETNSFST